SSFSMALNEPASPTLLGVWGGGDLMAFEGAPDPGTRYQGEAQTGWVGFDARSRRWVAGVAVSYGTSRSDYSFAGGQEADERGWLRTTLTTFYPYGRWTIGKGLEVRGLAGAGLGDARHQIEAGGPEEAADLSMTMGSVGVRQALPLFMGVSVAVRADASFARMMTGDGEETVDSLRAEIWRRRMGAEISRRIAIGAVALEPFLESAVRRDGGDGLTGNGIEYVTGLRFSSSRLQIEARRRLLAVHTADGAVEQGVSLTARLSPQLDGSGLSMSLSPQWGAPTGAADALWQERMPRLYGSQVGSRTIAADVGYGVMLARGVLTPFAAAQMAGYGRGVKLGTRFSASQANLGFELSGERREAGAGGAGGPDRGWFWSWVLYLVGVVGGGGA
ncbi:MAG: autotransporter outer membrane beta-barrel domain-containing protein, partial [Acidobacteria bacterium]|nr:autotransporter outer membrane beta-barrel domain-containing protein [Acidobacteriota bacterium]